MPIPTLIGKSPEQWDFEVVWPWPSGTETLTLDVVDPTNHWWSKNRNGVSVNDNDRVSASNIAVGGSGGVKYVAGQGGGVAGGFPFVQIDSPTLTHQRGYGLEGLRAMVETLPGGIPLPTGAHIASVQRVWWLKWLMFYRAVAGPNPTIDAGLLVMPQNAGVNGWPTRPVGANNRGGFGFNGDGAGQWQYSSYDRTGVGLARENIALPAHNLTDFNQFEIVIVGGRAGFNPYVEFWFNSALVATRNWTALLLESIGGAPVADANEWNWTPHIHCDDQGTVSVTSVHLRAGRFLRDGTEVQGF